ncbi:MAG: YihY/virulence factor BrkB family protein [candidate division Zixibacteria bacterium]|nr:YihY/virulence factor BrkB family protein [candidate division Zixibacteria bacterium]
MARLLEIVDRLLNNQRLLNKFLYDLLRRTISFLKFSLAVLKDVYTHTFFKDNVGLMAAAISFYAVLSVIPLLLVFVSISGYVLNSSEYAFQKVSEFLVALIPSSTTSTINFLHDFINKKVVFGAIGIGGLIWAGSRIFAAVENSVNVVWKVENGRPFWKSRILSVIMVPASILALILSIILTAIYAFASKLTVPFLNLSLSEISTVGRALQVGLPIVISIVLFTLIYKYMPNREIPFLSAAIGAVFAAMFWEIAKLLFDIYVKNYTDYTKVYGSFGTLVIAVFWIYYSSFILLVGAEIGVAIEDNRKHSYFLNAFKKMDLTGITDSSESI